MHGVRRVIHHDQDRRQVLLERLQTEELPAQRYRKARGARNPVNIRNGRGGLTWHASSSQGVPERSAMPSYATCWSVEGDETEMTTTAKPPPLRLNQRAKLVPTAQFGRWHEIASATAGLTALDRAKE
jgi:hypothetical protein